MKNTSLLFYTFLGFVLGLLTAFIGPLIFIVGGGDDGFPDVSTTDVQNETQDNEESQTENFGVSSEQDPVYASVAGGQITFSVERDVSEALDGSYTYLRTLSMQADDVCQSDFSTLSESFFENGLLTIEGVRHETFAAWLEENIPDFDYPEAFVDAVDMPYWDDQHLRSVCSVGDRVYGVFGEGDITVAEFTYSEEGQWGAFQPFQTVPAATLFGASQLFQQGQTGELILATMFGDAGMAFWKYYRLDDVAYTSDLIESCRVFASEDATTLTCARLFEPAQ